MIIVTV